MAGVWLPGPETVILLTWISSTEHLADMELFHFVYGVSPQHILLHFPIEFASFSQHIASFPQRFASFPQQIGVGVGTYN